MKNILFVLLFASTALAQSPTPGQSTPGQSTPGQSTPGQTQTPLPDNTRKNVDEKMTAENQGGSAADREMTKNIRREIMNEKSISAMAKNVKVITIDGKVSLRGPVHSEQEKALIASLAEKVAGKGKVTNQLEVKK